MRRLGIIAATVLSAALIWVSAAGVLVLAWRFAGTMDDTSDLARIHPQPQATVVYDRLDHSAFRFYLEQRIDVTLDRVSPHMVNAILAAEDRRFYRHHGLDAVRIAKAAWRNWRAGRILEGGSTITQQLARAEQLSPARTFTRKIREAAIAARIEERYSKSEILEAYLNTVYFGDGYYGVEAASRGYFGKSAADLEPHEAALLAALVRSPSGYSPTANPSRARARRNLVLRLMRDTSALTDAEYRASVGKPLRASPGGATVQAASSGPCGLYFQEEVRRELMARFGGKEVLQGGLRVYTGYDAEMQCAAERAIVTRVAQIAKARKSAKDLQGSLVAIEPSTGEVRALVGGRDFNASSFDRATQARRQPGSAFKPIIYAAALEHGYAPASVLRNLDEPIMANGRPWLPAGEHEETQYTLRSALKISSNRAAARLLQQVGLGTATYYAQRLGIASRLPAVPSLALGTGGVTLMELTSAYAVFANQGIAVTPHLITRVEDRTGHLVWAADPAPHPAVTRATAFMMTSMLADVIASGTGTGARAAGFKLPAAGKTGTTDDYDDAWFIGYTPHLVAGVWFGMDQPARIMNRGFAAVVAVPAWAEFMKHATAHDRPDWYDVPPDVEKVEICRLSGLRATEACRHGWLAPQEMTASLDAVPVPGDAVSPVAATPIATTGQSTVITDYFPIGTAPSDECHVHGGLGTPVANPSIGGPASYTPADLKVQRVVRPDGTIGYIIK